MNREIWILETFAADRLRPAILDLISELKIQLEGAKLNRRNCLIAKTTGTTVATVGTVLSVAATTAAMILAPPVTFGVLGIISVCGIGAGVAGGGVSIGTTITDKRCIRKKDKVELQKQLESYQSIRQDWLDKVEEFQLLKTSLQELMDERVDDDENIITNWLSLGLFKDIRVQIDNIKPGDHIYRYKVGSRILYHHGVYLGQIEGVGRVIDFGAANREYPVTTSIEEFLGQFRSGDRIYRRDYKGLDIPIEETIELAQTILSDQNWKRYHLLGNNCEHFATFLKLKIMWSTQVDGARSIVKDIMNGAGRAQRAVQVGVEVTEGAIRVAAAGKISKLTSILGLGSKSIGTFAKVTVVLAPIMTAVDIGMLVKDFNTKQSNIQNIAKALEFAEKELRECDLKVELLQKLK